MGGHIALLSNPRAGKGQGRRAAEIVERWLHEQGEDVRLLQGASVDETRMLAAQALADGPAVLIVVGGDGTLSCVLDAAIDRDVPIVLIPAGTGNDLARALHLPLDPVEAGRLALQGVPRRIDVGEVRSADGIRPFVTVAALGFDARVSDRTDRLRWPRGPLRYYLALVIELLRLHPVHLDVALDDGPIERMPSTLIAVGNTSSYGGGMPICADAEPDDGLFDVVRVRPIGRLRLLRLFPLLLRGRHLALPEVAVRRARSVSVSAPDLLVYADGECVARGSCTIGIRPSALTVLVPRS